MLTDSVSSAVEPQAGPRPPTGQRSRAFRGGQSSGTSLISANAAAFESSHGLHASKNAPTCRECGEAFTRAANELLADQRSHIVVGDAAFIFWTRKKDTFDIARFMRPTRSPQKSRRYSNPCIAAIRRMSTERRRVLRCVAYCERWASGGPRLDRHDGGSRCAEHCALVHAAANHRPAPR